MGNLQLAGALQAQHDAHTDQVAGSAHGQGVHGGEACRQSVKKSMLGSQSGSGWDQCGLLASAVF